MYEFNIIGGVLLYHGTTPPEGWLFCDGKELKISEKEALFAVIGAQFGGNEVTTFKLPKLAAAAGLHYIICAEGQFPTRD